MRCEVNACRVPEFGVQMNALLTGTTDTPPELKVLVSLVRQESNTSTI
jgi:hypothetical protein